ncbi:MAG: toll/interleukin-1 receptor domain-containing protein [Acidobacteria bacterium]|nr:toll/interleukin-1 receptor domain-containing protein [Acidobacteriota bacterium]
MSDGPEWHKLGSVVEACRGETLRYRAFLSYARKDHRCAQWLHTALEQFRTPRALRTSGELAASVPARLGPIFRDRTDLSGGGRLSNRIEAALSDSEVLIVLCSPAAAASEWVDRECQLFMKQHGPENVFPVIASGLGNSANPEAEFFPPAIRGLGLLAADLREGKGPSGKSVGDGKETGRLKLIAGLLKVPLDALIRRERQRLRLLLASLTSVALLFAGVAVAATWFAYRATIAEARANVQTAVAEQQRNEAIAARDREALARTAESAAREAEALAREEEKIQKLAAEAAEAVAEEQRDAAKRTLGDMYAERGWAAVRALEPLSAMRLAIVGAQVAGRPTQDHIAILNQAMDAAGGSAKSYSLIGKGAIVAVASHGPNRQIALSRPQKITLLSVETGQETGSFAAADADQVIAAQISPAGDQILLQTSAQRRLVDIASGATVWSSLIAANKPGTLKLLWPQPDRILSIRGIPDEPRSGDPANSEIEIIDAKTGTVLNRLKTSIYEFSTWQNFLVSPDKKRVLIGTETILSGEAGAAPRQIRTSTLVDLHAASFRIINGIEDEADDWFEGGAFFDESGEIWQASEHYEDKSSYLQVSKVDPPPLEEASSYRVEDWENTYSLFDWDEPFELDYGRQRAVYWALQSIEFRAEVDGVFRKFARESSSVTYLSAWPSGRVLMKIDDRLYTWSRRAPESVSRLNVLLDREGFFLELGSGKVAYLDRVGRVTVFDPQPAGPKRCTLTDKRYRIDGFEVSPDGRYYGYWSGPHFLAWDAKGCGELDSMKDYALIILGWPTQSLPKWIVAAISQTDAQQNAGSGTGGWWSTGKGRVNVHGSDGLLRIGPATFSIRNGNTETELKSVLLQVPDGGSQAIDREGGGMALSYPGGVIEVWNMQTGERSLHWDSGFEDPLVAAVDFRRSRMFVLSGGEGLGYLVDFSREIPKSKEVANGFGARDAHSMPFISFSPDGRYLQMTVYGRGTFIVPVATPDVVAALLDLDADERGRGIRFEATGFSSDSRMLLGTFSDNYRFGAFNVLANEFEYIFDVRSLFDGDTQLVSVHPSPAGQRAAVLVSQLQQQPRLSESDLDGNLTNLHFTLIVVNSDTGKPIAQYLMPEIRPGYHFSIGRPLPPVGALDFSSDGTTVAWLTQGEDFGYRGYSWSVPTPARDFEALKREACASRLVGLDRILNLREFGGDTLVKQTWKRDTDVCTGRRWEGFDQPAMPTEK